MGIAELYIVPYFWQMMPVLKLCESASRDSSGVVASSRLELVARSAVNQRLAILSGLLQRVASSLWHSPLILRNSCKLLGVKSDLLFFFRSSRCKYQIFGIVPPANAIVNTQYVACKYGLDENLFVLMRSLGSGPFPSLFNCPSDKGSVAGSSARKV